LRLRGCSTRVGSGVDGHNTVVGRISRAENHLFGNDRLVEPHVRLASQVRTIAALALESGRVNLIQKLSRNRTVTWCAVLFHAPSVEDPAQGSHIPMDTTAFRQGGLMTLRLLWLGQVFVFVALFLLPFPPSVEADEVNLTLGAALDSARQQNPQVALARTRVSEAEGMRIQAGLMPNPSLYATSENTPLGGSQPFTFGKDTDDYVYLIQKIELGGKRSRRVAFASENVSQMSLQAEVAMHQLLARVAAFSMRHGAWCWRRVTSVGSAVTY
jgi:Outer membrane efflux protein